MAIDLNGLSSDEIRRVLEKQGFPSSVIESAVEAHESGLYALQPSQEAIDATAKAAGDAAVAEADEFKMWLGVRVDLTLSRGKALAQSGHCFGRLYLHASNAYPALMERYLANNEPKISVKVKSEEILHRIAEECAKAGIPHQLVRDAGHSEIPPNTPTFCAFGPWKRSELPKYLHKLQKLKDEDFPNADPQPSDD